MDLYAENILDHYRSPRGKRVLPSPTVEHAELNPVCGDELTVQLTVENDRITDIGWNGTGCAISQASMSILSEELVGKSADDLQRMSKEHVYDLLGVAVGPRRFKCALLSLHTVKNAFRKAKNSPPQSWIETVNIGEE